MQVITETCQNFVNSSTMVGIMVGFVGGLIVGVVGTFLLDPWIN